MCGIVAIAAKKKVSKFLLEGLRKLEYRGYDSCGIATINNDEFNLQKNIGTIDEVLNSLDFISMPGITGIAHTRWATHGKVTNENAHPLLSNDEKFAIVHNGIITNYENLKEFLVKKKFNFQSETDSEVIANLLQYYFDKYKSVLEALKKVIKKLEGCYSIVISTTYQPNTLYGAKYLLPLVLGLNDDENYLCSDIQGFYDYTKKAINIDDNEYVVLTSNSYKIFSNKNHKQINRQLYRIEEHSISAKKGKYKHYMLKEIFDLPEAINNALKIDEKKINIFADLIINADHTYIVGIGTTYYVAKASCYLLHDIAKCFATATPADEFIIPDIKKYNNHALFISQSGETYDTKEALRKAKDIGVSTSAIVNSPNSTIAYSVDQVINQNSGVEVSVVSTKAAIAQLTIIYSIAWFIAVKKKIIKLKEYNQFINRFQNFSTKLLNLLPSISEDCKKVAARWSGFNHFLCLGKGIYYPLGLETALKIKEVSYIHAEGMPTGFLKHGTLALIDEKIPCLFFVPSKSEKYLYDSSIAAVEEVRSRNGIIIGFSHYDNKQLKNKFDHSFIIPEIEEVFYPIYQLVVAQLFAYHLADSLNRPIDKPRNLAKSVTVP